MCIYISKSKYVFELCASEAFINFESDRDKNIKQIPLCVTSSQKYVLTKFIIFSNLFGCLFIDSQLV